MNSPIDLKLRELKESWIKTRQERKQHSLWMQERNQIEEKTEALQNEIHGMVHALYRQNNRNPRFITDQESKINEKQELLKQLNNNKKQVDHLLDKTEEESVEKENLLKDEYVNEILKIYPEYRHHYDFLEQSLIGLTVAEKHFSAIEKICSKLCQYLSNALSTRKSIKGFGIFRYAFGISPNLIISKSLQECEHLSRQAIPVLKQLQEYSKDDSALFNLYIEIEELIKKLQLQCQLRWGFRHLDTIFFQILTQLIMHQDFFAQKHKEIRQKIKNVEQDLENWLLER